MRRIQSGDIVQLLPRAQFRAWVNYIKFVRIEIQFKMVLSAESELRPNPTSLGDEIETQRKVRYNYRYHKRIPNDSRTIRLLVLHAGAPENPIHCNLITSSLKNDRTTEFEALSYCWGDPTDTKTITLSHVRANDDLGLPVESKPHQVFEITSGLDEALRYLRYAHDQKRLLWVDAICINQSDVQERGFQVDIMGDIYAYASSVRVWLGNSDDSSRRAMALVRSVSGRDFAWQELYNTQSFDSAYPKILEDISRLFSYPWFRRVWVVQEVWKARKAIVSCGLDSVPWEKVVESNDYMVEGHGGGVPGFHLHTLPSIWRQLTDNRKTRATHPGIDLAPNQERNARFALLDLVLEGFELNATDPRDKIYAMLGMRKERQSGDAIPSALLLDYNKTVNQTFGDLTRWWITEYNALTILSAIHSSSTRTWQELARSVDQKAQPANHPSWALWHDGNGKWAKRMLGMSGLYDAARKTSPSLDLSNTNPLQLSLMGLKTRIVESIHSYPFFQIKDGGLHEAYARLFDPLGNDGTWNYGPTFDNAPHRQTPEAQKLGMIYDHYVCHWSKFPETKLDGISWENGETQSWVKSGFPCHGKCFFRHSLGVFGLCPPMTRPGDIVVVLFGGSVPYVLREREGSESPKLYELIGECYVQGLMQGAAIEAQEQGKLTALQFVMV